MSELDISFPKPQAEDLTVWLSSELSGIKDELRKLRLVLEKWREDMLKYMYKF